MAKLTAWLVTLIGLLLVLSNLNIGISIADTWVMWLISLAVIIIGIGKLVRNYSYKKKK